ncbi:MAG TPA: tetratricopeptide repeat protein [Candidatus Paceibacterota bacterium]|nr:tetratricopeptide repeat protein [Verrucomicrobiota bacterium]HSA11405.1 tetratricopeptide repeat protein [Candidatus Paceibacterota bacterium]
MNRINNRRLAPLLGLLLAAATLAAFWPVIHHDFVNCDDQAYVYENPALVAGLSWPAVVWAFTTGYAGNWHPLTWLSHLLDVQWFGLKAGGHHFTSLLLHVANTLLLFVVLRRMTGALWRSALVAALFALHPLHVESVAWIAERKDVLSAFFFLLTLWAYARYAEGGRLQAGVWRLEEAGRIQESGADATHHVRPPQFCDGERAPRAAPTASSLQPAAFYCLALIFLALGLMSKPMLVTLPFVLLLLDYWPLRRLRLSTLNSQLSALWPLLREKLPFFALAAASSVVTFVVQQRAGAVAAVEVLPLDLRLENAVVSYAIYLAKTLWPSGLAIFYPYRYELSSGLLAAAVLAMIILTVLALISLRRQPYLAVGWFWFLGTLVPVIGIVQVGQQALADRYTYLPLIGVFLGVIWALADWLGATPASGPGRRIALFGVAVLALMACLALTRGQVRYWQDSETLFRHVLAVTTNNALAHHSLGDILAKRGRIEEAETHFAEAVRIKPRYAEALSDLGLTRVMRGKLEEGIGLYRAAIAAQPGNWRTHHNLARALCLQGKFDEAVPEYRAALELEPGASETRGAFAAVLVQLGRTNEACQVFEEALKLKPNDAASHFQYASLLLALGQAEAAARHFEAALQWAPGNAEAHRRYGLLLADSGKTQEALAHLREAVRLRPGAEAHYNLGTLLLQQGQPEQAVEQFRQSLRLKPDVPAVLNDLAWVLAANASDGARNGAEAASLAERACKLTEFREPLLLGTLAAAYAEAGRFAEARSTAQRAIEAAQAAGQAELAARNRELLKLYEAGKPCRQ